MSDGGERRVMEWVCDGERVGVKEGGEGGWGLGRGDGAWGGRGEEGGKGEGGGWKGD